MAFVFQCVPSSWLCSVYCAVANLPAFSCKISFCDFSCIACDDSWRIRRQPNSTPFWLWTSELTDWTIRGLIKSPTATFKNHIRNDYLLRIFRHTFRQVDQSANRPLCKLSSLRLDWLQVGFCRRVNSNIVKLCLISDCVLCCLQRVCQKCFKSSDRN